MVPQRHHINHYNTPLWNYLTLALTKVSLTFQSPHISVQVQQWGTINVASFWASSCEASKLWIHPKTTKQVWPFWCTFSGSLNSFLGHVPFKEHKGFMMKLLYCCFKLISEYGTFHIWTSVISCNDNETWILKCLRLLQTELIHSASLSLYHAYEMTDNMHTITGFFFRPESYCLI